MRKTRDKLNTMNSASKTNNSTRIKCKMKVNTRRANTLNLKCNKSKKCNTSSKCRCSKKWAKWERWKKVTIKRKWINSRSRSSTLARKWKLKMRRMNRSQSNSSKLMIDSRCSNRTQEKLKIKWNMSQKRLAPISTMMQRNE